MLAGWGAEAHLERLEEIVRRSGLTADELHRTLEQLRRDPDAYFVSAEAHERWRGAIPYDEYPMRRIASIGLLSRPRSVTLSLCSARDDRLRLRRSPITPSTSASPSRASGGSPRQTRTSCRSARPGLGDASIFRNYNLLLEEASKLEDLEALVLVHQDAEIVDAEFCAKVRSGPPGPGGRDPRLRRRDRRPEHRLVGRLGDTRLVLSPVRGVRRRRDPGRDLQLGGGAAGGADRARST